MRDDVVHPAGGQALGVGQPQQVVAGGPARLQPSGVKPGIIRIVVDFPAPFGQFGQLTQRLLRSSGQRLQPAAEDRSSAGVRGRHARHENRCTGGPAQS